METRKHERFMPEKVGQYFSRKYFTTQRPWHVKGTVTKTSGLLALQIARRYGWDEAQVKEHIDAFLNEVHLEMMRLNSVRLRRIGDIRAIFFKDILRTPLEVENMMHKYVIRHLHVFVPLPGAFHNANNRHTHYIMGGVKDEKELITRMRLYLQNSPPQVTNRADFKVLDRIEKMFDTDPEQAEKELLAWEAKKKKQHALTNRVALKMGKKKKSLWAMLPDDENPPADIDETVNP